MSDPSRERRRRLIVDVASQGRMVRRLGSIPLSFLFAQAVVTAILMRWLLDEVAELRVEVRWAVPLAAMSMAFVVITAVTLALQSLKHSHAVAGPCVRLRRSFERIRRGETDFEVTLRKGDELQDLADEMNLLLAWLRDNPRGDRREAPAADGAAAMNAIDDVASLTHQEQPAGGVRS